MRLRTKFAIGLLLVTLVLSVATYGGLELYKDQQTERVRVDVNETATQTAAQISAELFDRRDYIGFVAGRNSTAEFDRSQRTLEGLLDNSRFRNALLVDADGTVVDARGAYTDAERTELVGSNLSDGVCIGETLSTGDQCVSDPQPAGESHALVITAPVFREGEVAGALVGVIRINERTFLSTIDPLETSSQSVVVTHEATTLYGGQTDFESTIAESARVERFGWTVRVERDRSLLERQLRQLALAQGLGLFLVLGSVVSFGYWEYVTNLRQTERLLSAFGRLQGGDYEASLSLTSGEEWVQISEGFNDLSEGLQTREEQLREREQRLEVLNRVMRHNLRNEMVVILNYAELVEDFVDDDQVQEMARTIYDRGQTLTGLGDKARQIEAVLDDDADPQPIDLAEVAETAVSAVQSRYDGVDVETDLPASQHARAIPAVRRAVENVVENACEHTDSDDPLVAVTLSTAGDTVTLRVVDDGPCIPEQERAVLRKGTETDLEHGSGLGLWLVYWVVDRSEGTLDIGDREPRGSVVTMTFDATTAPGDEQRENETEADGDVGGSGATEDEADGDVGTGPDAT